jgi:protein-S-isoprenylcysteine O-methyltransferase Ste14
MHTSSSILSRDSLIGQSTVHYIRSVKNPITKLAGWSALVTTAVSLAGLLAMQILSLHGISVLLISMISILIVSFFVFLFLLRWANGKEGFAFLNRDQQK